jgi:hypothetical protein
MPRDTPIKKPRALDVGDRVGASFGVTLNMGDFQSLRVEAWAESTKRSGETSAEAFQRLYELCEKEANQKAEEFKNK